LFEHDYGEHLLETPLSKDQQVEELEDGKLKITATVADTPQLRWWLMGFGAGVEVLSTSNLRSELADEYRRISAKYADGNTIKGLGSH